MSQLYLNNRPISQALATHYLAEAMPHLEYKKVKDLVVFASMGYKTALKQVSEYGVHIS